MKKVYIKNMVCDRCISSVEQIFRKYNISPIAVNLGEVTLNNSISHKEMKSVGSELQKIGFELVDSIQHILVVKIKGAFIELFNRKEVPENFKISNFMREIFPYDYSHISRVFSHHENDTIEHYVIKLRIEKAKELLSYNDQNISEIAYNLGYTSSSHFSRQFKKIVGVSPSEYRKNPGERISLKVI